VRLVELYAKNVPERELDFGGNAELWKNPPPASAIGRMWGSR
jgi:hypothetical protein